GQQARLRRVGRAILLQLVAVDAIAVDVAHIEFFPILRRVRVRVEPAQAAVRGFLMAMLDDGADLPRVRWIRAALAMVVAGLGEVPEVIDDASGDERVAVLVE